MTTQQPQKSLCQTLSDTVRQSLDHWGVLDKVMRPHLIVAFSGGLDSTALLLLCQQLQKQGLFQITAAYYHHGWRGAFPPELPLLQHITQQLQVPLMVLSDPARALKSVPVTPSEAEARALRYNALATLCSDLQAQAVLTAHHADDQAETMLFRVFRGTGLDGLQGIQEQLWLGGGSSPALCLRPLLHVEQHQLKQVVRQANLKYFKDPSNDQLTFKRNLIRHELLPRIEKHFPQVRLSLRKLRATAQEGLAMLDEQTAVAWASVVEGSGHALRLMAFQQLAEPLQRRLLRLFVSHNSVLEAMSYQQTQQLLAFLQGRQRQRDSNVKCSLGVTPQGDRVFGWIYNNEFYVLHEPVVTATAPAQALSIHMPLTSGQVSLPSLYPGQFASGSLLVQHQVIDPAQGQAHARQLENEPLILAGSQLLIHAALLATQLGAQESGAQEAAGQFVFRPSQSTDVFQPLGMSAPMRLMKYLANRKIPAPLRHKQWVLAFGDTVLWLLGAHSGKVSELTRVQPNVSLSKAPVNMLIVKK